MVKQHLILKVVRENGIVAFTSNEMLEPAILSIIQTTLPNVKPGDKIEIVVAKENKKHALA